MPRPKTSPRSLLQRPGVRYLITGVSVYLFELAVIFAAQAAGASSIVAVGLSFWSGLVLSFIIQKFFTFSDKRTHHKVLIPQVVAVTLLVLFNFGFTLLVTKLLQDRLPPTVTRTLALGITTMWNFYLYKTRIFKKSEPKEIVY
jgi:putative flippase GtrA